MAVIFQNIATAYAAFVLLFFFFFLPSVDAITLRCMRRYIIEPREEDYDELAKMLRFAIFQIQARS